MGLRPIKLADCVNIAHRPGRRIYPAGVEVSRAFPIVQEGAAVRPTQRYLVLAVTMATTAAILPIGMVATAPPARAECTSSGYATVCAQGEVRGADGVPQVATPVVPYPCAYDWYCGTGVDLDVAWDPGRPGGGGGIGPRR